MPYGAIIDKVSAEQGVPVKLVRAVIQVESAYRERARSPKGAMGLMQLMPATARQYAVADPYDPASNIEAGIKHLKTLLAAVAARACARGVQRGRSGGPALQRHSAVPGDPQLRLAHPQPRKPLEEPRNSTQLFAALHGLTLHGEP